MCQTVLTQILIVLYIDGCSSAVLCAEPAAGAVRDDEGRAAAAAAGARRRSRPGSKTLPAFRWVDPQLASTVCIACDMCKLS